MHFKDAFSMMVWVFYGFQTSAGTLTLFFILAPCTLSQLCCSCFLGFRGALESQPRSTSGDSTPLRCQNVEIMYTSGNSTPCDVIVCWSHLEIPHLTRPYYFKHSTPYEAIMCWNLKHIKTFHTLMCWNLKHIKTFHTLRGQNVLSTSGDFTSKPPTYLKRLRRFPTLRRPALHTI